MTYSARVDDPKLLSKEQFVCALEVADKTKPVEELLRMSLSGMAACVISADSRDINMLQ